MVFIPGGTFMMGIYQGVGGHLVTVSDFYMDTKEVTVGEYQIFAMATATPMPPAPTWTFISSNLPMANVTWQEASAYAAWAGKRLPTEAEFEYAMRGGAPDSLYPWGDTINAGNANYNNNIGQPTTGGNYPANGYGLLDMSGNVWEYCADWYASGLQGPVTDPTGPGSGTYKIVRGGSYIKSALYQQNAPRHFLAPTVRYFDLGFRCASSVGMGSSAGTAPIPGDANGNTIPDWWEQWHFGLAAGQGGSVDPNADTDRDGMSNYQEYIAGTDPTTDASVFEMVDPDTGVSSGMGLRWSSVAGKTYDIERCSNLLNGFTVIQSNITATPPFNTFTDTSATSSGVYFYKVKVR